MDPVSTGNAAGGTAASRELLAARFGEFVGGVFVAPMIQQMQKSVFKSKYLDGGRGESAFGGQMALELGKRIGRSPGSAFTKRLLGEVERRMGVREGILAPEDRKKK